MLARDNPYSTERILQLRFRPQRETWESIYDRLKELNYHAAIVGPEGSGKTTLLEDLEPYLQSQGFRTHWLWLNLQERKPDPAFWAAKLGPRDALLVDGAEVLSPYLWWRLKRHVRPAGAFLLTLHRPGRVPALLHTATTPDLLVQLVDQLEQNITREDADSLWRQKHGNLREALRTLYDGADYSNKK